MTERRPLTAAVALALVLLGACSSGQAGGESGSAGGTIRIEALDSLRFDPAEVTVSVGEPVRFVVTNEGHTDHDFFVGDEQAQEMHGGQMGNGMDHGGGMAALELAPGETKEATITFDETGEILYGCHEPGHYEGGMVGTITVTG